MQQLRLMVDVDGVLADFVLGITRKIHEKHPEIAPFPTSQQKSWDFKELPPGVFMESFSKVAEDAYNFNADLDPLVTPEEARRLMALSLEHEVYFATNRPGGVDALRGTRAFLETKLGIMRPNIILTSRKGEFAKAIDATHSIDDKAGNALFTKYYSGTTKVFLLNQLYNQFDQTVAGTKVLRIKSFADFLDVVTKDAS